MYKLEDIKTLHLEITEKCQAGCPFCPRHTADGKIHPLITNAEITLEKARAYFSKDFIRQIRKMYMCGNYGDPIIARDTLEVYELFRYNNKRMGLDMHTNGGARTSDWWKDLAYVFHNDVSAVVFSFDGLEDTNHIYRKNVNWDICMQSAEAFIKAGGNAVWSFIVFKHNEHQVEEARELAKKMGFVRFIAKKSSRFTTELAQNSVVKDAILPPDNPEYRNKNLEWKLNHKEDDAFLSSTEIECVVQEQKNIYVSARGQLFPCCWVAGILHPFPPPKLYGNYDGIDLNTHTMKEIFDSGIFEKIEQSWSCSIEGGRMRACATNCSKHYNFFKAQFT